MNVRIWIAAAFATLNVAAFAQQLDESENPWSLTSPAAVGREMFSAAEFGKLEALAKRLLKNRERAIDGRFQLSLLEGGLQDHFESWTSVSPGAAARLLADWKRAVPGSTYQPLIEAMNLHADAWAARGEGGAGEVSPTGWRIFGERNAMAWALLMETRQRSSAFPGWYSLAISLAFEMGKPRSEIDALFDEGIARYPGYYEIYFAYLNYLQPKWHGSFEDIDAFIRSQVAAITNPDGEALYARLYWFVDQCDACRKHTNFEASKVDWPRMRKGFDIVLDQFPNSERNRAAFTDFACRAADSVTYRRLRIRVNAEMFGAMASGPTLAECDARFARH